jgi:hypothetical protein
MMIARRGATHPILRDWRAIGAHARLKVLAMSRGATKLRLYLAGGSCHEKDNVDLLPDCAVSAGGRLARACGDRPAIRHHI